MPAETVTQYLLVEGALRHFKRGLVFQPWMFGKRAGPQSSMLLGVYDLIPLGMGKVKSALLRSVLKDVRRETGIHILTLARSTSDRLVEDFKIEPERIHIARPGVDFRRIAARPEESGAHEPYIVYVGRLSDHKGLNLLVNAWHRVPPKRRPDLVAVLPPHESGGRASVSLKDNGVYVCTSLSDDELSVLVSHAAAAVVPSLDEGYGLPLAEAASLGTPIIAHDLPAFREFPIEDVRWVTPGDMDGMSSAIESWGSLKRPRWRIPPPTWEAWREAVCAALWRTYRG